MNKSINTGSTMRSHHDEIDVMCLNCFEDFLMGYSPTEMFLNGYTILSSQITHIVYCLFGLTFSLLNDEISIGSDEPCINHAEGVNSRAKLFGQFKTCFNRFHCSIASVRWKEYFRVHSVSYFHGLGTRSA